ncbi:MAG TPA: hypothetical protein VHT27_01900 [Solirubrobacteraceae bacterium]|nr:hypothetical protein [Solirubrobacteraceae bacterium]
MGYTHYFAYDPNAEEFISAWPQIIEDARLIAEHVQSELHVRLTGGLGEGEAEFSERWIWLNGPTAGDLGHETLLIDSTPWKSWDEQAELGHARWAHEQHVEFAERGLIAAFCKTARKPYDIAVTSILLRAARLAPRSFVIASDGDWQHEWQHGANHWEEHCPCEVSPTELVARLFAQLESPEENPLVTNVWDGPQRAQRRGTARQRNVDSAAKEVPHVR